MSFHTAAQRVRGTSHRKSHAPCQDACRVVCKPDGADELVVGAVADGGSPRALSHIGARLAVSLAIASMKAVWNAHTMRQASVADLETYWRALYGDCRRLRGPLRA